MTNGYGYGFAGLIICLALAVVLYDWIAAHQHDARRLPKDFDFNLHKRREPK